MLELLDEELGELSEKDYGLIGQIQINMTNGTEPVDVVHQFCLSHDLPLSKRREILTVVCSTIACHRLRPILYVKKIYTNPSSSILAKSPVSKTFIFLSPDDKSSQLLA